LLERAVRLRRGKNPELRPEEPMILFRRARLLTVLAVCGSVLAQTTSHLPADNSAPVKAWPFGLKQVRLLDSPFREAMRRNETYLLSLEPDRLLHMFRVTSGLPSTAKPYGGWEAPEIELRGHSLGHYLSACSLGYAAGGTERLKSRVELIVAELARIQMAMPTQGYGPGYVSAFPESFIDRVDARQKVWAPWYTLHKIMAGLLDAYEQCGNKQALDVLVKMADWVRTRVDRLKWEQMQAALDTEFGGMNEVLANLYGATGNPEHLRLARAFDHRKILDPLLWGEDRLDGLHANTQIPKIIGAAREYELTGNPHYRDIASYFWRAVALHRSYVIGGHSDGEHFFPVQEFSKHLSPETTETCNTYNMLKLTRHLFGWQPDSTLMDFYERGLYNHILASQDPERGMFVYLMSLKPGHFKTYSTPVDSFWCCVGTGMENHTKYADTVYFHGPDSLYVNLFIPSEVDWFDKGIRLRQETRFPEADNVRLMVSSSKPVSFGLFIRYPSWCKGMTVSVNGKPEKLGTGPGSYVRLERVWRGGDLVEIRIPLALWIEPLPGPATDTFALLCGPIVLAGKLGGDGLPSPYARDPSDLNEVPSVDVPFFAAAGLDLLDHVVAVPGMSLTFETRGVGRPRDVTLIPFYRTHHERYTVYWKAAPASNP
jgi:uncharacterized protein